MEVAKLLKGRDPADIIRCDVDTTVRDVVALLAGKRIGAVPVMERGTVAGIFSERDVLYRLADEGALCLDRKVGEVMTSPPITVEPSTDTDEAMALMTRRRIRHLPVCDKGEMCGFVSIGDLVKSRMDAIEAEAQNLRTYIQTA